MASASTELPENLQITQDLARDLIEDDSAEVCTSELIEGFRSSAAERSLDNYNSQTW